MRSTPEYGDRRNPNRLVVRALVGVAAIVVGLIAALVVLDGRDPGGDASAEPSTEAAASERPVELPADYLCLEYDIADYEAFAGAPVNEEHTLSDVYPGYLDMIGERIHCTFMVGWPADDDGIELKVEVHPEPDLAATEEALDSERRNREAARGRIEDYSGHEGDGFVYESEESDYLQITLVAGTAVATASVDRIPEGRTDDEARAILLDLIDQAWELNAAYPR